MHPKASAIRDSLKLARYRVVWPQTRPLRDTVWPLPTRSFLLDGAFPCPERGKWDEGEEPRWQPLSRMGLST